MTHKELIELAKKYLENGDFDVSGYALMEKAGVERIIEEADVEYEDGYIDSFMKGGCVWDDLSNMAYHTAINEVLSESQIYVRRTLDVNDHEQRLRYQAEMSPQEQEEFAALYKRIYKGAPDWLEVT